MGGGMPTSMVHRTQDRQPHTAHATAALPTNHPSRGPSAAHLHMEADHAVLRRDLRQLPDLDGAQVLDVHRAALWAQRGGAQRGSGPGQQVGREVGRDATPGSCCC